VWQTGSVKKLLLDPLGVTCRSVRECAKLGMTVSATSVVNIPPPPWLGTRRRRAGPKSLRSQAAGVLACDFFMVETFGLNCRCGLSFGEIERQHFRIELSHDPKPKVHHAPMGELP
jgi:hypothetical protein